MTARHLRIEQPPAAAAEHLARLDADAKPVDAANAVQFKAEAPSAAMAPAALDVEHWRTLALENARQLRNAEAAAADVRRAADDMRARAMKYKERLDSTNARATALQIEVTKLSAERDALRARLVEQDAVKRRIHEFRQSILDGPIWALFAEFCTDASAEAGGEKSDA